MCGIAGILSISGKVTVECRRAAVAGMLRAITHRGPDETGHYEDRQVTLGHARLSIIDLAGGRQPLFNEDRSCVLVYNGEVYDYQRIRDRLAGRHTFATNTDSEVLVHLYEDEGEGFCEQLNGMYAYAIWDSGEARLQLAIDPVGIKPLYHYRDDHCFVFCSELRGMICGLRQLGVTVQWNHTAIRSFLQLGWFPAPDTPWMRVRKLGPGERLTVDRAGQRSAQTPLPHGCTWSDGEAGEATVEQLDNLLTETVRSQLVADVPVGVFLSGGIDSSLLTAVAGKLQPGIKTFCVGFSGESDDVIAADESQVARVVADHLGTEHHTLIVDPRGLLELLDDAWLAMDEPIVDPAVLPLLLVSREARRHVKVCLSGDGGDEVFGGYPHHWLLAWKRRFHAAPVWLRSLAGGVANCLPRSPSRGFREKLRRARVGYCMLADQDYVPGPFSAPHANWLVDPAPYRQVRRDQLYDDDWYYTDGLLHPLAGQMLPKTDRVSMYASIEVRVPLLDNRMLAFGRSLPFSAKVGRNGVTKVVLRQLLARYVPAEISRRPKHGFRVPLAGWFRNELKRDVRERLGEGVGIPEEVIRPEAVRRLVAEHLSGQAEHSVRLWALMTFSHWAEQVSAVATSN
jgi:asparagine synthase (glutamine-hydrolysing)